MLLNLIIAQALIFHADLTCRDFSTLIVSGKILNAGKLSSLYDMPTQAQMHLCAMYQSIPLPFNHLAFEAFVFSPLAQLSYRASFYLWDALNIVFLLVIAWRLQPWLSSLRFSAGLIFALTLAYWPIMAVLAKGQDSILLTLLITEAYVQAKKGNDGAAGMLLALGLFKFHLVIPILACLLLNLQWRAVKGFVLTALPILAVSFAMIGKHGVFQYVHLLLSSAVTPEVTYANPRLMPTLRGMIASFLPGTKLVSFAVALSSLLLFVVVAKLRPRSDRGRKFDLYFAATLATTYLVSFNTYEHDMSIIFPATLLILNAVEMIAPEASKPMWTVVAASLFPATLYMALQSWQLECLMCIPALAVVWAVWDVSRAPQLEQAVTAGAASPA